MDDRERETDVRRTYGGGGPRYIQNGMELVHREANSYFVAVLQLLPCVGVSHRGSGLCIRVEVNLTGYQPHGVHMWSKPPAMDDLVSQVTEGGRSSSIHY